MANVLVVGGAGYIGATAVAWLKDHGHSCWVLDDLSRGHQEFLFDKNRFTQARCGDREVVSQLLQQQKFDLVMHYAAFALVGESVAHPEMYRENNVEQTQTLLQVMLENDVQKFVFSSTCATFGDPGTDNITEETPQKPINPYGETKLAAENVMKELANEGLQTISLRYFNAAGADPQLRVGEWHDPESHLIPNIFNAVLKSASLKVFGSDYPTPDGTCVRDYIHVWDLAQAHGLAMERLLKNSGGGIFEAFNLGTESGDSILQVIETCKKVLGREVPYEVADRRPGDPPRLVAGAAKARKELGFQTRENSLEWIIQTAWDWHKKLDSLKKNG